MGEFLVALFADGDKGELALGEEFLSDGLHAALGNGMDALFHAGVIVDFAVVDIAAGVEIGSLGDGLALHLEAAESIAVAGGDFVFSNFAGSDAF